jgi:GNAT superfamily N-acetyltransferase
MEMQILEVVNSKTEQQWMDVPKLVYKADSNWIPHLKQDIAKVFDPKKNKFFVQGKARRWILVDDKNQCFGRIAAFHWKKYSNAQKQSTGGIGFFECIENDTAAKMLLSVGCDWLKSEGMEAVDGPINFGEKDAYWGLLIENFTDMGSYRMNYNPPYYKKFFEDFGFKLYYEQWCYRRDMRLAVQDVFVRKNNIIMSDPDYRVGNSVGKKIEEIAEEFLEVYNNAWAGHMGFKKMDIRQAMGIMKSMKPIMDKEVMIFAYYKNKPIAFYLNIPELNEVFQHVHGNLNLWGKLIFLWRFKRRKYRTMVGVIFGVDREFHGKGIEGAMIKWTEEHVVPLDYYDQTILTWIGDFNPKMIKVVQNLGADLYRKLATYRFFFDQSKPFERHPDIG